jgi:hypothetical protein
MEAFFIYEAVWSKIKKGVRMEIQPRFKIQYPMKNRCNNKSFIRSKQHPATG